MSITRSLLFSSIDCVTMRKREPLGNDGLSRENLAAPVLKEAHRIGRIGRLAYGSSTPEPSPRHILRFDGRGYGHPAWIRSSARPFGEGTRTYHVHPPIRTKKRKP